MRQEKIRERRGKMEDKRKGKRRDDRKGGKKGILKV